MSSDAYKIIDIPKDAAGMSLSEYLAREGYSPSADCNGRGVCGKCKVELLSGSFLTHNGTPVIPDTNGMILSCRAFCTSDGATVKVQLSPRADELPPSRPISKSTNIGLAIDLGTTTVAVALVSIDEQKVLLSDSFLNPQRAFGADVMSRISAANNGKLAIMRSILSREIEKCVTSLANKTDLNYEFSCAAVTGNPTMLHILAGISPSEMGCYPFTPNFLDEKTVDANELFASLKIDSFTLLPSASAFLGSDVTAGIYSCKMTEKNEPSLYIDLGTNGEMVLSRNGKLLGTSAAAGPALEGAGIACGTGGVYGAICAVDRSDGRLIYTTVKGGSPVGICGSGLIDLVANLLDLKVIDETGYMQKERYVICKGNANSSEIYITQEDIHSLQLTKSAIRAGIEALLYEGQVTHADIKHIYLAGGLGYYINFVNAQKIGLFPKDMSVDIHSLGNASLAGAIAYMCSTCASKKIALLAKSCETVELNFSDVFNKEFISNISF